MKRTKKSTKPETTAAAPAPEATQQQPPAPAPAPAQEATTPAQQQQTGPTARAALCRISQLCAAAEKRAAAAQDRAAVLALYLAAVRDAAAEYWKHSRSTTAAA